MSESNNMLDNASKQTLARVVGRLQICQSVGKQSIDIKDTELLTFIAIIKKQSREIEALKHDIARHVDIAANMATENERLRNDERIALELCDAAVNDYNNALAEIRAIDGAAQDLIRSLPRFGVSNDHIEKALEIARARYEALNKSA